MAAQLEVTGNYRVLRRLAPHRAVTPEAGEVVRQGLFVDVETTGLDPVTDEIIELAMVPFTYTQDGRLLSTSVPFQSFRQPRKPIPAEVTALTGINDAMVAGASIRPEDVTSFVAPASFVVAHNASFDRRFLERFCDVFTTKAWGCSMSQVDWASAGFDGVKLAYLAGAAGFFYDRHRAVHDCHAAIELLARAHAGSERPALAQLLERPGTWTCWKAIERRSYPSCGRKFIRARSSSLRAALARTTAFQIGVPRLSFSGPRSSSGAIAQQPF
jgi:DNA polymerase-3 subunit epsilon